MNWPAGGTKTLPAAILICLLKLSLINPQWWHSCYQPHKNNSHTLAKNYISKRQTCSGETYFHRVVWCWDVRYLALVYKQPYVLFTCTHLETLRLGLKHSVWIRIYARHVDRNACSIACITLFHIYKHKLIWKFCDLLFMSIVATINWFFNKCHSCDRITQSECVIIIWMRDQLFELHGSIGPVPRSSVIQLAPISLILFTCGDACTKFLLLL